MVQLSNNAMAFDVYTQFAQHLHRVPKHHKHLVPWASLHAQFGQGFKDIQFFRRKFRVNLKTALVAYPEARFGHPRYARSEGKPMADLENFTSRSGKPNF